jgi:hypothetical protein
MFLFNEMVSQINMRQTNVATLGPNGKEEKNADLVSLV